MRIALVTPSLKPGGLERVVSIVANGLSQKDFDVSIFCLRNVNPHYEINQGVTVHLLPEELEEQFKVARIFATFFWLRSSLKKERIDVLLGFGEGFNAFIIAAALGLRKKIIVSNRASPLSSLKGMRGLLNPFFYKFADTVIVQTKKSIELLQSKYRNVSFEVIPNPFHIPLEKNPIPDKENIILNVGRIGGQKNQHELISFFSQTPNSDWKLVFVGDGPSRKYCEDLASKSGISSKVIFTGNQKNVEKFYQKAKIFAFTSTSEGFPNALGEAMAHSLPVISYDCISGPSELIVHGKNGFLVKENDHLSYINYLKMLMGNPHLRKEMGENAVEQMKNFEFSKIIDRFEKIILSV